MIRDPGIRTILEDSRNPAEACTDLVDAASQAGGKDNITAIVIKVE